MSPPNIVFILTDDLGWRDLRCYGSTFHDTPHLDQLAADGMRFSDAYAAAAVCSPTRASILSGKYPAHVGITNWIHHDRERKGKLIDAPNADHLSSEEYNLAQALKDNGYQTWHVGKWHLSPPRLDKERTFWPENQGFDKNFGGCSWGSPHFGYFSPWDIPSLENGPDGEYLTDRLTDEAIRLIEGNDGRPFFLNLWYYSPHRPIQAKSEKIGKYREKAKKMGLDKIDPFEVGELNPSMPVNRPEPWGDYERASEDSRVSSLFPDTPRVVRRRFQSDPVYAGMIESLDENVGRLLDALDRLGQTENTVVFFTSDNGGLSTSGGSPTCNSPLLEGKSWLYEGGTREPLLVKYPGFVPSGSICNVPVTSPDFYPTILELAGLPLIPKQHTDGESIYPLLNRSGTLNRGSIFWHYPQYGPQGSTPGSAIRKGDYKLLEFFEDGRLELYNLRDDLSETRNLASSETALVRELHQELRDWRRSVDAKIPQPNSG